MNAATVGKLIKIRKHLLQDYESTKMTAEQHPNTQYGEMYRVASD